MIAAQGPFVPRDGKHDTTPDFWRLVVEQNVNQIVALGNVSELKGKKLEKKYEDYMKNATYEYEASTGFK